MNRATTVSLCHCGAWIHIGRHSQSEFEVFSSTDLIGAPYVLCLYGAARMQVSGYVPAMLEATDPEVRSAMVKG